MGDEKSQLIADLALANLSSEQIQAIRAILSKKEELIQMRSYDSNSEITMRKFRKLYKASDMNGDPKGVLEHSTSESDDDYDVYLINSDSLTNMLLNPIFSNYYSKHVTN